MYSNTIYFCKSFYLWIEILPLWITFMCLCWLPIWLNLRWQMWQLYGLYPVCFLKWSLRLHDFLNTLLHPLNRHWKMKFFLRVLGFLYSIIWCHSSGTPSKCFFGMILCIIYWFWFLWNWSSINAGLWFGSMSRVWNHCSFFMADNCSYSTSLNFYSPLFFVS